MLFCALLTGQVAAAQPALRALDAVWLTPRLVVARDELSLAASAGYGGMGNVAGSGGSHQRAAGALAVGLSSRLGLALELRFDGRWDVHDVPGGDDSLVGDPRLLLRYARAFGARTRAGLELGLWAPGGTAPSIDLSATSVDLLMVGDFQLAPRWALTAALGPRLDQSANSVEPGVQLSRSDTLALGVSSSHALLARLAASTQLRGCELSAELSADVLLGEGAPLPLDSPLRAALLVRRRLGREQRVELSAMLSLLLSGRPPFREERHVPYEPRAAGFVGVRYLLGRQAEKPAAAPRPQPAPPPPVSEPPALGTLLVQVSDEAGEPLPDVRVAIREGEERRTGGAGRVLFEAVAPGERSVEISAPGFATQQLAFTASAALPVALTVTLLAVSEQSLLRVLVRDAQTGAPLAADCSLLPAKGKKVLQRFATAADGSFQLSLAEGQYRVTVLAPGYHSQTRAVAVRPAGVTLFNIDLTPESL